MHTLYRTISRGVGIALCASMLVMTAHAATNSLQKGTRDEVKTDGPDVAKEIAPGLEQVTRDADKIPERKVEETDRNLEKSLGTEPKMTTDPAVKEYTRLK